MPLGIDPTQWPLDVDVKKTAEAASANPLYPGGTVQRVRRLLLGRRQGARRGVLRPGGHQAEPANANSHDPQLAKQAMQQLQAENMLGTAASRRATGT